ncbi:TolC family protein [Desulfopila sp. IMCC35008]|uniref:TolC family protein n=1 Tax=Desulfopila sp. IMCC35008 TaxID=2653858 RepID=UPI0013D05530|nr:TolC family protein [Desulfopila sp. IMCC35008]
MKAFATRLLGVVCLLTSSGFALADTGKAPPPLPSPWNLAGAVQYALDNNPRTHIALKRLEGAQAKARSASTHSLPVVSLSAEYSQTDNPMYSFGNILNQGAFDNTIDFNDPGRTDDLQLIAGIRYRLYDGGRIQSGTEAARATSMAVDKDLAVTHQQLAFEVVKSYHTILQAREMVQVRKSAIEAIDASLTVGKARYDAGDLLREDLLNLELQKARAVEEGIRAEHRLQLTNQIFWNILGIENYTELPLPTTDTSQELPQTMNYDKRQELQAIDRRIEAARAALEASRSGNLPTIDTFAQYRLDHGMILDESGDSWMAGVRLDYTLYDGARTEHDTVTAKAQLMESEAERDRLRLALSLELQRGIIMHNQSLEKLQVTEKMVEVAKESAKLSRLRFQEGVILAMNLIDMEMRLTDALARRASARTENSIAIANLLRVTGNNQYPTGK